MAPTSEPLTMGETARSLQRIENAINDQRTETAQNMTEIRTRLENRPTWTDIERLEKARDIQFAEKEKHWDDQLEDMRRDVCDLQGTQRKVAWSVVGAVIVAVLSLVLGVPPVH